MKGDWKPMEMKPSACLVILSGGQDSTTCLFWAKKQFAEVQAVSFDYGQKHIRELDAARVIAKLAGVTKHHVVKVGPILRGRSPLTNPEEKLETYANATEMEQVIGDRVELTFVPMRNALFMVLAANVAVCEGITKLITGVCQADNANYPDCRANYVDSMAHTIQLALGFDKTEPPTPFEIITPLMDLSKPGSIMLAINTPGAYHALAFSHTAYDGLYPPVGKDHATTLRAQGFELSGLPDPLVVRAWREGLMALPETPNYDRLRNLAGGGSKDVGDCLTIDLLDLLRSVVAFA